MAGSKTLEFSISREFDAPRQLVWEAWTQAEAMAQWWGPKGMAVSVRKLELRPGGMFLFSMTPPGGSQLYGRFVYREIVPPGKLVYQHGFSDEKGNPARHPMAPTWPLEMLNVVTFTERAGKTTVSLRVSPLNATEEEKRTFEEGFSSMKGGFGGTLDQLETYLAKEQKNG